MSITHIPAEIAEKAIEGVRQRLSWPSLHWGAEGLHPDAIPHIARAALAAAWPLIAEEFGKALPAVLNLQGTWDASVPPGGSVCPLCGDPWESEASCQHAKDLAWHDQQVRAGALKDAAEAVDLPGSTAVGYYASEQHAGYSDAERDVERWLIARAEQERARADA
jgi:hypothetical protein